MILLRTSLTLVFSTLLLIAGSTVPASAQAPWFDEDWAYRIPVTAVADSIDGGAHADFTLLLDLSDPRLHPVFSSADSTGADLVVTAGDGTTVLDFELVTYDPVAQTAELWFKAPVLSSLENEFFLYFALANGTPEEAGINVPMAGAAWTADHLAVYHYAEDPSLGQLTDWGPGANHAVAAVAPMPAGPGWTSSDQVDAAIGTGWKYDGVDLWTYSNSITSTDSSFTISAWFANDPAVDKGAMAFQSFNTDWDISFQATEGVPRSDLETMNGQVGWLPDVTDSDLHHYRWVMDAESDTLRFYFDGIERAMTFRWTEPGVNGPIFTGESMHTQVGIASPYTWNELDLADGIVDEFRIYQGVRGAGWTLTEYRNQRDPYTFYEVGDVESSPATPTAVGPHDAFSLGPMSIAPNPFRAVTWIEIPVDANRLEVKIFDAKGRLVQTLRQPREAGSGMLRYLWDGRDSAGSVVSNGIYYIRAQDGPRTSTGKAVFVR